MAPAAVLNLWKQQLRRVPDDVWSRVDLDTLILADNALDEIPEQIGRLKRLRTLDLGHNELTRVPDALGEIELRATDNRLEVLPDAIGRLWRLDKLDLRWVTTLAPSPWIHDLEARGCVVYR